MASFSNMYTGEKYKVQSFANVRKITFCIFGEKKVEAEEGAVYVRVLPNEKGKLLFTSPATYSRKLKRTIR